MIKKYVLGPIQENCYIIIHGKSCVIIDPGSESEYLISELHKNNLLLKAILLTHGHYDHIGAVNQLVDEFHVNVYGTAGTKELLLNTNENLSVMLGGEKYIVKEIKVINKVLTIDDFSFDVYETPGHTKGDCLYYLREDHALFTGDTLFKGGCGRIDFPTGSQFKMLQSLKLIKELPFDADVYPGHGEQTLLSYEKNFI